MEKMEGCEIRKFIKLNKEKAFNDIVIEFSQRIYKIAFMYTRDEHLSQDITQDTLIKIYRYMEDFTGNSSIYTWIYRITINTCKNSIKKESKYKFIEDISFFSEEATEDEILKGLERGYLMEALNKLKYEYKTVLYLYYYDEFKIKEISEIMEKKEGTIKTWLKRAKIALEKELIKYGE